MIARFILAIAVSISVATVALAAGDDSLYAPPPPPGAASVRLIGAMAVPTPIEANIAGKKLHTNGAEPTRFITIMQGPCTFSVGTASATRPIQAGQHYSMVVTSAGGKQSVSVIPEPAPLLGQALIVLYNFSAGPAVSLKTPDGTTTLVDAVAAGKLGSRPVNPVASGFAVFRGKTKLGEVPSVQLRRGASYGVFLLPGVKPQVIAAAGPTLTH